MSCSGLLALVAEIKQLQLARDEFQCLGIWAQASVRTAYLLYLMPLRALSELGYVRKRVHNRPYEANALAQALFEQMVKEVCEMGIEVYAALGHTLCSLKYGLRWRVAVGK